MVDFETIGTAEPECDLRSFPGPAMGSGVELLTAVMCHYQRITGRQLSADRIMAWHLRQALGDVLWRSEAGLRWRITGHHQGGSRTWPRASAH